MHRFVLRVRYGDTDQMGFAYHANFLRWFEVGRTELIRAMGSSYRRIEESGIWLPVLEARCRYLKPARYDDRVGIETGILELKRASVRFGYRVARLDDPDAGPEGDSSLSDVGSFGREVSRLGDRDAAAEGSVPSEAGELIAWGSTDHCFLTPAGRPARPPASLVAMLERAPRIDEEALARC